MSTTPPPEPPTRRLDPTPPPVYERVVEPGVPVAPADPNLLFVRLEDSIASLRTGLVFVGVLAVLALGLAIYALTQDDGSPARSSSGGVSSQRVSQLDDRIDRLSRQVQQARADARAARDVGTRVDDLARTVGQLRSQATDGGGADATQAITDLDTRLDKLEQQVQALGQGQTTP
jgi:outer membrane murein-binding lipoprotein Lpp